MAQQVYQGEALQQQMLRQRMPFVIIAMIVFGVLLLFRVISFQFPQDPRVEREFAAQRDANSGRTERVETPRGNIYDRNGNPLAYNMRQYRVGISPNVISDPAGTASDLAVILDRDEFEIYELLTSNNNWELLESRVDADVWQQISELDLFGITVDRVQKRLYPQGLLAGQVLGFVAGDGEDLRGYNGVEGYYESWLAGIVRDQEVSNIPFDLPEDLAALGRGADLVLTIDRDVQFLVEAELALAVAETGAIGGTVIVMNPRNGYVLAMASNPSFNPNEYFNYPDQALRNPAISDAYEPGSVFKVITVAAGLEKGVITREWTYNDQGALQVGGITVQNWDRRAYGIVDTTQILVNSLNIGAANIALQLGWQDFYGMVEQFGIGSLTGIDLQGESAGILRTPTSLEGDWSESDLATNSYGQGLSVTPLQMLQAVNAIANDGLLMEPRIVHQIVDGDNIITSRPSARRRPISAETAQIVTEMMISVVRDGLDERGQVPGYAIAGKTGTAEIASPTGYLDNAWNMTFVGFFPADDPQVSILVKLDRPTSGQFASQTAAPAFSRLTQRLVHLLEIPTDDVRWALAAEGVDINQP